MSRDILGEYDDNNMGGNRATNGGQCEPKPINYSPPQGPTSQSQQGPGLHGTNHGPSGSQGKH